MGIWASLTGRGEPSGELRWQFPPAILEQLESRILLSASEPAIELFELSPALFAENQGQWEDQSVRYVFQGSGATVLHTDSGPVFHLFRAEEPQAIESTSFSVHFDGARAVIPVGLEESETYFNYFMGDQSNWRSNVPAYEIVAYEGLYEGIDLHTWGRRNSLKYEFHVAPGADYSQIQISYDGIDGLYIDDAGALHVQTELGELVDEAPYIYQRAGGEEVEVEGTFVLVDADTYSFVLSGEYDVASELIIDPDLVWSTYLGGSTGDYGQGIAVDGSGNILVTGFTSSSSWVSGGFDTTLSGLSDAFVAKLSASGVHLWSTYVGGSDEDWGYGIAVDAAGNALVVGQTWSLGWTSGGFDTTFSGLSDAFVAKLSASGDHVWSTYLGGSDDDWGYGIAVDSSGNALVTGCTYFPSSGPGLPWDYDAFAAKLSAGGDHVWSTYLGGDDYDLGYGIAVDAGGNAFVTGWTESSGWTSGGFDTSYNGERDAFVAKLSASGDHVWSTYLGGSGRDGAYGNGIAVDAGGNVLVTGHTESSGWTSDGFDVIHGGGKDAFVAKLSSSGDHVWSTYLGGTYDDWGFGIAVDAAGNALVAGGTSSSGWTSGGFDTTHNGGKDAFVAKLSSGGGHVWSTYLGGGSDERGEAIAVDADGNALVAGYTDSAGWASGGFDTSFNGGAADAFVAKISYSDGGGGDDPDLPDLLDDGDFWNGFGPTTVGVWDMWEAWMDVGNGGTGDAGGFWVDFYASTNNLITTADWSLGGVYLLGISSGSYLDADLTLLEFPNIPAGDYYVGAIIDSDDRVDESDELNNTVVFDEYPLTVGSPDLIGTQLNVVPATANWGQTVDVQWEVTNQDAGAAGPYWVGFYLSEDTDYDAGVDQLLRFVTTAGHQVGYTSVSGVEPVTLPASSPFAAPFGTFYIVMFTDYRYEVLESNEANNFGTGLLDDFDSVRVAFSVNASDGYYSDKVRVTWDAVDTATSYEVWRGTTNESTSATKIGETNLLTYDDASGVQATTYWYWVKAKNGGWTSDFDACVSNAGHRALDGLALTDFVTRFYVECLGREPEPDGLYNWADDLADGTRTGADLAVGFMFSQEYFNRNRADSDFVDDCYQAFFNREPDVPGKAHWLGILGEGAPREDVLYGFVYSGEFTNLAAQYNIDGYSPDGLRVYRVRQFVTRFYVECLDRQADPDGLANWTADLLAQVRAGAEVAFGFMFSQEYFLRNRTDSEFVDDSYRAFFGREPDAGGKANWVAALAGGASRVDVLKGFTDSLEFANLCDLYGILPNLA